VSDVNERWDSLLTEEEKEFLRNTYVSHLCFPKMKPEDAKRWAVCLMKIVEKIKTEKDSKIEAPET